MKQLRIETMITYILSLGEEYGNESISDEIEGIEDVFKRRTSSLTQIREFYMIGKNNFKDSEEEIKKD